MEKLMQYADELMEMNNHYNISDASILLLKQDMKHEKVRLPIIGKFSVGKSALINALLGYSNSLLKEDVSPETAIPTEILYDTKDTFYTVNTQDVETLIDSMLYRSSKFNINEYKSVRLKLKNEHLLAKIPDVMLVDMPGFESGIDVHNKAIDQYLPDSLSYIMAFQSDDMILRNSMIDILKELNLHQMPVAVVITKCDKVTETMLQENTVHLKTELAKYITNHQQITYCFTCSKKNEIDEVVRYLETIQQDSEKLLYQKFTPNLKQKLTLTKSYIQSLLKNASLSESELDEKIERLETELDEIKSSIGSESSSLKSELPQIVQNITGDVHHDLQSESNTIASMVVNHVDIKDKVNMIIRESITKSLQKRFIPRIEKYIKEIEEITSTIEFDINTDFSSLINTDSNSISKRIITAVLTGISWVILGPLVTIIGSIINHFTRQNTRDKKLQETKSDILKKLQSEVYPDIISQITFSIEKELLTQIEVIEQMVTTELSKQKDILQQSLHQLKKERSEEIQKKQDSHLKATTTISRIEDMINGL